MDFFIRLKKIKILNKHTEEEKCLLLLKQNKTKILNGICEI